MRLWPRDVELGREAGRMRQEWNDRRGAAPFFRQEISPLEASTRGALAELFLARLTGLEWRNPFSEVLKPDIPDVGENLEARGVIRASTPLAIRPKDQAHPEWNYCRILVEPDGLAEDPQFSFAGWIPGAAAMVPERYDASGKWPWWPVQPDDLLDLTSLERLLA